MLSVYSGAVQERDFLCRCDRRAPFKPAPDVPELYAAGRHSASDTNVTERRRRFVFAENCGSIPSSGSMASPIAEASALCLNLPNERTSWRTNAQ